MTVPAIRHLSQQVTDAGKQVGNIHVSAIQSGNLTASTAISTFVASASSDASAIGQAVGQTAEQVIAAVNGYGTADEVSASRYRRLTGKRGHADP